MKEKLSRIKDCAKSVVQMGRQFPNVASIVTVMGTTGIALAEQTRWVPIVSGEITTFVPQSTPTPTPTPTATPTPTNYPSPSPLPFPLPVNGYCGTKTDTCLEGELSNLPNTYNTYYWMCNGINGGVTDFCDSPIVHNAVCGEIVDNCLEGELSDLPNTYNTYYWMCNGINGGSSLPCSAPIDQEGSVEAVCGDNKDTCTIGDYFDLVDTPTHYKWQCGDGQQGGEFIDIECTHLKETNQSPTLIAYDISTQCEQTVGFDLNVTDSNVGDGHTFLTRDFRVVDENGTFIPGYENTNRGSMSIDPNTGEGTVTPSSSPWSHRHLAFDARVCDNGNPQLCSEWKPVKVEVAPCTKDNNVTPPLPIYP